MSKAILSLFCVAALFSSGLVLAKPGTGDAVKGIGDKAGDLTNKAIEGLADGYDPNSLEAKGIGLAGDAANAVVDLLGGLAGKAINGAESAADKTKDLANAGYDGVTAVVKKGTEVINNSGNQGGQANSGNSQQQQQSNGGNTIQIPTIFFLILAIFNH